MLGLECSFRNCKGHAESVSWSKVMRFESRGSHVVEFAKSECSRGCNQSARVWRWMGMLRDEPKASRGPLSAAGDFLK